MKLKTPETVERFHAGVDTYYTYVIADIISAIEETIGDFEGAKFEGMVKLISSHNLVDCDACDDRRVEMVIQALDKGGYLDLTCDPGGSGLLHVFWGDTRGVIGDFQHFLEVGVVREVSVECEWEKRAFEQFFCTYTRIKRALRTHQLGNAEKLDQLHAALFTVREEEEHEESELMDKLLLEASKLDNEGRFITEELRCTYHHNLIRLGKVLGLDQALEVIPTGKDQTHGYTVLFSTAPSFTMNTPTVVYDWLVGGFQITTMAELNKQIAEQ